MNLLRPKLTLIKSSRKPSRSLAKGITAGLIGGLVATAARSLAQRAPYGEHKHPKLPSGEPTSRALAIRKRVADSPAFPWAVGAAAGAAYGAVAEYYPQATSNDGASFGMALGALSQDGALAAIGLVRPETTREKAAVMTSFVIFGVVTETVRRIVRRVV